MMNKLLLTVFLAMGLTTFAQLPQTQKAIVFPDSLSYSIDQKYTQLNRLNANLVFYSKNYNRVFKPDEQPFYVYSDFYEYFLKDEYNIYDRTYYNYGIAGFNDAPGANDFYGTDANALAVGAGLLTGIFTAVFTVE